jgi:hypothetical protein
MVDSIIADAAADEGTQLTRDEAIKALCRQRPEARQYLIPSTVKENDIEEVGGEHSN